MPVKLISTDFDGTLVGMDEALDQFFDLLKEQRRHHDLQWVINTGRNWDTLYMEMQNRCFPVMPDWVVLVEREVYRISRDHPVGDYEWNTCCEEVHTELFEGVHEFWDTLSEFITSQTGAEALRDEHSPVAIRARNDHEADRIHLFIHGLLPSYPQLAMMRNSVYFRFAHESYHKGSGLQRIQDLLELGAEDTMVIGDHYNDIPMLDPAYAHSIACPSNAIPEVQAHVREMGGLVATLPEAAGVVEAWRSFI